MKNINLLPQDIRPKRLISGTFSKVMLGCVAVPLAILALFVIAVKIYEYYNLWNEPHILVTTKEGAANYKSPSFEGDGKVAEPPAAGALPEGGQVSSAIPSGDIPPAVVEPAAQSQMLMSGVPRLELNQPETEHPEGYTLRMGLFIDTAKAEALVENLKQRGVRAFQQVKQEEREVYVVFLDGYTTYEEGMITARALEKDNFPAAVEFRERGVRVKVETFLTHGNAREMADRLKAKGHSAKITKEQVSLTIYQIKSGPFPTYREAKETQLKLEQAGFSSDISFKE